jgi:outer membrane receptor for ferrienterochelin and colicins
VPTELITREQIERSGATDVAQVLLEQTGIELQGGHPVGTGVFLQGLGDQRVLVLLDGQPVVGRIAGMIDISRIPVVGIERIEVVKGPQSTLYGSAAMGGVVNIITRPAPDHRVEAEASLTGGEQGRREGALRVGAGSERVRVSSELGRRTTEVVSGLADSSDASTGRWDVGLKGDVILGAATASLAANVVDERQQWRTGPLYFTYDNLQWNARTGLKWNDGPHRLEVTAYGAGFDHVSRRSTEPNPSAGGGDLETQGLMKLEGLYGLSAGRHGLDLGLAFQQDRIRSDRVAGHSRAQSVFEPFAQHSVDFNTLGVVTGARVTASSVWGTAVTPQLAVRWRPTATFTLRSAAGLGYRIPDFKETAITFVNVGPGFGYVVQGNPALEPEHSGTVSLGLELAPGGMYARAQTFYTRFQNFIESEALPDSGGLQVFTYQNRASGTTAGMELETGALIGKLRLEASYAWLTTRDDETGGPLLGRPEHSARATAQWASASGLRLGTTAVYTGVAPMERDDSTGVITSRPGWLRIDARVSYALLSMVDLALGGENLFDTQPAGWPGFTGRRIYASCSWRLGGVGVGTRSAQRESRRDGVVDGQ